ncbi:MAG: SiaB family protein kinase [Flavobacteriales bacterium]|nr:SiaB family protein kinase [Flavobacteriales bacterium]
MEPGIAYALYKGLAGDDICFAYSGAFNDGHTGRLIDLGEAVMEEAGAARNVRQRLAYVMVEAYQNIVRHRAPLPPAIALGAGRSLFMLRSRPAAQQVMAVNPVVRSEVPRLEQALSDLVGLDPAGLKQRFLQKLSQEGMSARGGAGLGLIEMARRSGNELAHRIIGLGEDHVLFQLLVEFGDRKEMADGLELCAVLHGTFCQQRLLFVHKGPQRADVNDALVQLVEHDIDGVGTRAPELKRALLGGMDVLHRLSGGRAGITVMGMRDGGAELAVGVWLDRSSADLHEAMVSEIASLDLSGITARYRRLVVGGEGPHGLELALVELARLASAPLAWHMQEEAGGVFCTLVIEV